MAHKNHQANRKYLQEIGIHTLEIVRKKFYQSPNGKVNLEHLLMNCRNNTVHFGPRDLFHQEIVFDEFFFRDEPMVVEVVNESTIAAIHRVCEMGREDVGVLNFASAKNPGGGVRTGAQAQEESLCRASALLYCIQNGPGYALNKKNKGYQGMYSDHVSYCPSVPVFRGDDGVLLVEEEVRLVGFVSSAAPNCKKIRKNRAKELRETLTRRIDRLLALFAMNGHRTIILGAFGCGVFGNDPYDVAEVFGDFLRGKYNNSFDHVVFAILTFRDRNINEFREELDDLINPSE